MKRIILLIFILLIFPIYLFAAKPPKVGDEAPYHLVLADAKVLRVTVYAITLLTDGDTVAELYYNSSGEELDLITNADYTSLVSGANIPPGTYTELRLYTSFTMGLKGYTHYQYDGYVEEPGKYFYTKAGSTHENILAETDSLSSTDPFPDPSDYAVADLEMEEGELSPPAYPASSYSYRDISTGIVYRKTLDNPLEIEATDQITLTLSMVVENGLEFNDAESENPEVVGPPTNVHFNVPDITIED